MKRFGAELDQETSKRKPASAGFAVSETSNTVSQSDSSGLTRSLVQQKIREKLSAKFTKRSNTAEDLDLTERWRELVIKAGFACELATIDDNKNNTPFESSQVFPNVVLLVYPSKGYSYETQIGPFKSVRLLVKPDGSWRFQCPIYDFKVLAEGKFDIDIAEVELVQLASAWFSGDHVVCPGLIGCGDIEKRLGYKPGNILFTAVQTVLSAKCKVWHNPSLTSQTRASSRETADPRWPNVCPECRKTLQYVERKIKEKESLDVGTRFRRQDPSSNYKLKYLSPNGNGLLKMSIKIARYHWSV